MRRPLAIVALLGGLAGCDVAGDGDAAQDGNGEARKRDVGKQVDGTFVGRLRGTGMFVGLAISPPAKGERRSQVTVFACDAREICEWMSGSASGNSFVASSGDAEAKARGQLTHNAATGTVELGGERTRYRVARAAAAAGLYSVTVSPSGRLRGASSGGVGVTGRSPLPASGRGTLRLADGTRLGFEATTASGENSLPVRAGEARLIVLSNGQLRGAGKTSRQAGSNFFLRSLR